MTAQLDLSVNLSVLRTVTHSTAGPVAQPDVKRASNKTGASFTFTFLVLGWAGRVAGNITGRNARPRGSAKIWPPPWCASPRGIGRTVDPPKWSLMTVLRLVTIQVSILDQRQSVDTWMYTGILRPKAVTTPRLLQMSAQPSRLSQKSDEFLVMALHVLN